MLYIILLPLGIKHHTDIHILIDHTFQSKCMNENMETFCLHFKIHKETYD